MPLSFIPTAHAAGTEEISIHLDPYVLGEFAGVPITATLVTVWFTMIILTVLAVFLRSRIRAVPGGLQNIVELAIGGGYKYVEDTLESKDLARKYFPVLATIFFFLLVMNWIGLLPGVTSIGFYEGHGEDSHLIPLLYPPATDLNITLAFAFISMFVIELAGIAALGVFKYGGKFITFSGRTIGQRIMNFLVGMLELISELGRIISFSFRLFGNIFAGKTLLVVGIFFVPFILPVPLMLYEVFVGFIQAGVFAFLTLVFIKLAVAEPHGDEH